ncbi:2,5-diamino-6-ribosylamino-4(3H)-pyrimidinone 5'-phosphate reductase [Phytophthora citrophthora]|uniref:2,5-diamino-6-ribosylamino-4(3H)-pyrimidinone 5'-phosphate reductase n=1 Tax=Phytophthora citrophthora TaxID=4793 RepID=A0AAD9GVB8_9STRA|nr:2,5-diamino-6-ribosylamino-4(3H)-pyrimidinone 5'-phosphate reductase [Phytophthora citrophthora]
MLDWLKVGSEYDRRSCFSSLPAVNHAGNNPRPIIIDTNLRCPTDIKLFTLSTCEKPILLCARGLQDPEILRRKQILEKLGARVIECETTLGEDACAHVDLRDAFRVLKENSIDSVMVEGGSAILTSCLREATQRPLINLVVVTIAPAFIGGLRAVGGLLSPSTSVEPTARIFPRLTQPRYHVLEEDLVILGHLEH